MPCDQTQDSLITFLGKRWNALFESACRAEHGLFTRLLLSPTNTGTYGNGTVSLSSSNDGFSGVHAVLRTAPIEPSSDEDKPTVQVTQVFFDCDWQ
jgi:hypothetical protein